MNEVAYKTRRESSDSDMFVVLVCQKMVELQRNLSKKLIVIRHKCRWLFKV